MSVNEGRGNIFGFNTIFRQQSIVFTTDDDILAREQEFVYPFGVDDVCDIDLGDLLCLSSQTIVLINDNQLCSEAPRRAESAASLRAGTPDSRPKTRFPGVRI